MAQTGSSDANTAPDDIATKRDPREWSYPEEPPCFSEAKHFVAFIKGGGAPYTSRSVYKVMALDSQETPYEQDRQTERAESDPKRGAVAAAARASEAIAIGGNLTIVSNDDFIVGALSRGDLKKWQSNDWRKPDGKPPHALDIWLRIARIILARSLNITAIHLKDAPNDWKIEFEKLRQKKPGAS